MPRAQMSAIQHRVAIAGRVAMGYKLEGQADWTLLLQRLSKACVEITQMPPVFQRRLELKSHRYGKRWATLPHRPDRTQTAEDGIRYFMALPPGNYTLQARASPGDTRLWQATANAHVSEDGSPLWVDLVMATTGIVGQITNEDSEPIARAHISVQGSNEQTWSDRNGHFQLLSLEAPIEAANSSPRQVIIQVAAADYDKISPKTISLYRGMTERLNVQLTKSSTLSS